MYMPRRKLILGAICAAGGTGSLPAWANGAASADAEPTSRDLAPTPWIDSAHPAIVRLAQELTRGARSEVAAAVRLHDAVRDRVLFGIAPGFYALKASEVLEAGVGYCNTKTTLFSALLRARGIATRTRMFDLSAAVLSGLFDTGTARVDHAVTEVWLKGRWWGVDSYVVDLPLERAARALLARDGKLAGYGVHSRGASAWDGASPARIQCVESVDPPGWIARDHGLFEDVGDFYARTPSAHNRLTPISRVFIRLGAGRINRQINEVRGATKTA
jgi:transglutaminase-like putative cysteine protease